MMAVSLVLLLIFTFFSTLIVPCWTIVSRGTLDAINEQLPEILREANQNITSAMRDESAFASTISSTRSGKANPFARVQSLANPIAQLGHISLLGQLQARVINIVQDRFNLTKAEIQDVMRSLPDLTIMTEITTSRTFGARRMTCPFNSNEVVCDPSQSYRTIDGSCNNLKNPLQGRSFRPLQRFLAADYANGIDDPRASVTGSPLPSARVVSSSISKGTDNPDLVHTVLLMVFGQLIDHDLSHTAIASLMTTDDDGNSIARNVLCGSDGCNTTGAENRHCFPISVPEDDPDFPSKPCLMFVRSANTPSGDCLVAPRDQLNQITSYLDGSMIYGSTAERSAELRNTAQPDRGRLLVETHPLGFKDLLPYFDDPGCRDLTSTIRCFLAGDDRVNEHSGLMALQTIYHRYHNVIEEKLCNINPHWSGERLFQEARKIVVAAWQVQVFKEFLPIVLGPKTMKRYRLNLQTTRHTKGNGQAANAEIANGFATAAYRFGHSAIPDQLNVINKDGKIEESVPFSQLFNRPALLYRDYASGASPIDGIMRGLYSEPMQTIDKHVTNQVSEKLFTENPPAGPGTDLFSLNIQRARDHGIPGYIAWRRWCGLSTRRHFRQLKSILPKMRTILKEIYDDVKDIDLFAAGLLERNVPGGIVGPTFACIIARQFRKLRIGDRFWHERRDSVTGFTRAQLNEIRKSLISRVICDTADDVDSIQRFALMQPTSETFKNLGTTSLSDAYSLASLYRGHNNELEPCSGLPDINIMLWKD